MDDDPGQVVYRVKDNPTLAQYQVERAVELGRARLAVLLGGIGSGKTAGGQRILRRAMSEWAPGGRFMIVTPSYRTFAQVTLPEIRKFWPGEGHIWRYYSPASQPQIDWHCGDGERSITSTCYIRSAQDMRTVEEIRGPTLAGIWGDEVGTWNAGRTAHDLAFGRLRQTAPEGWEDLWEASIWWPRAWYTGSPRWGWLNRALGVKGKLPPHAWQTGYYPLVNHKDPKPQTSIYVRACKTEDNPHNGPDYAEMLRLQYGEQFAKQELDGDFVSPTGAVYPGYYPDLHELPHHKAQALYDRCNRRIGAVDWGHASPAAMVAIGIDDDDRAIAVREWSRPSHTADQMARIARDWERELGIQQWFCDPENDENIKRWRGQISGSVGVTAGVQRAKNAVAPGRDTERQCMRVAAALVHPSQTDKPGSWYYTSASECRMLNEHTAILHYASVDVDGEYEERKVKPKIATHLTDARRYGIHSTLATEQHKTTWDPRI